MTYFRNLSIRNKILLPFSAFLLIVGAAAVIFLPASEAARVHEELTKKADAWSELTAYYASTAFELGDDADANELLARAQRDGDIRHVWIYGTDGSYFAGTRSAALSELPAEANEGWDTLRSTKHVTDGDTLWVVSPLVSEVAPGVLVAELDYARVDEERSSTLLAVLGATGIVFLFGVGLVFVVGSTLARRVEVVLQGAKALAAGHLDADFGEPAEDELGKLVSTFDETTGRLRDVISEFKRSAAAFALSAGSISQSVTRIEGGATRQSDVTDETSATMVEMATQIESIARSADELAGTAAQTAGSTRNMGAAIETVAGNADELSTAVDQTASTVEEMTASIRAIAAKVEVVETVSNRASRAASQGGRRLGDTIGAISEATEDIGKIVKLIEAIADQTNLLALNAAIEAARAGDAGRGFAVVADEVQRLAERSMEATSEITTVVESVQRETRQAVELMGAILDEIVSSIGDASSLVGEVAIASQEQRTGAEQILGATTHMQRISQRVASSAQSLADDSTQVVESLGHIHTHTREVANATQAQKQGGDMIVKATEDVASIAQQNLGDAEALSAAVEQLVRQASDLKRHTEYFSLRSSSRGKRSTTERAT